MNQRTPLDAQVQRWIEAGLIDEAAGARILAFEAGQERRVVLRWPVLLAMIFGVILLAAGITLFVAAHWDELSPLARFSLVLLMTGVFHIGGAALAERFPVLATTLHALGTITLGASIFLTAQIFNLHENWATGVLLWAMGAGAGYILLQDSVQAGAFALLTPAWLISQWTVTTEGHGGGGRPLAMGLILTALCYLSAETGAAESTTRRVLGWIGGIALLPCVGIAVVIAAQERYSLNGETSYGTSPLSHAALLAGWTVAVGGPLAVAYLLRGRAAWINVLWAAWVYALILTARYSNSFGGREPRYPGATLALYALCALGSIGLLAWGLHEKRKERLNLGTAGFAVSVLFFYFDSFMDKLGRSASLLILGVLCLAGGYALEITRRRLMGRMEMNP